jgi:hypothetical protein
MNWGVKIFLTLLTFIIVAVSTGIYMVSQDHDSLVDDDYYEMGLSYDAQYEDKTNVNRLNADPDFILEDRALRIRFKEAGNKGKITFQRTADSSQDQQAEFDTPTSEYSVPVERLQAGKWKILLQWESKGVSFFVEENVMIP